MGNLPSLRGVWEYVQGEGIFAVWIILIGVLILTVYHRSWMGGIIFVFGAAFAIGVMSNPTLIENMASGVLGLLGMR